MPRDMHCLLAERRGEETRFVVGCADQMLVVKERLKAAGFRVVDEYFGEPPVRSETEKLRATRILGELFGN